MQKTRWIVIVTACALLGTGTLPAADTGARVQALVAAIEQRVTSYEAFVEELRITFVPRAFPGRVRAMMWVDELGERIEELSRRAGEVEDEEDIRRVEAAVKEFDERLLRARRRTRRVAVCGLRRQQGVKHPTWGLGQAPAAKPVYPPAKDFAGEVHWIVRLAAKPGETARRQVVALSLVGELKGVTVRLAGPLKGPAGKIAAGAVEIVPVVWTPPGEKAEAPTLKHLRPAPVYVPYDIVQPFLVTVHVPAQAAPGIYRTRLVGRAIDRERVLLRLELEVKGSKTTAAAED